MFKLDCRFNVLSATTRSRFWPSWLNGPVARATPAVTCAYTSKVGSRNASRVVYDQLEGNNACLWLHLLEVGDGLANPCLPVLRNEDLPDLARWLWTKFVQQQLGFPRFCLRELREPRMSQV